MLQSSKAYLQKMAKLTKSTKRKASDPEVVGSFFERMHNLPNQIDWRDEGFEMPVYNQKDCGSCYAFSVALTLQAQIFKQTNTLVPLRLDNSGSLREF